MSVVAALLRSRAPKKQTLLDVALFLSLVPLVPVLPFLMQLYLAVMLLVIYGTNFHSKHLVSLMMGVGAVLIMIIFYTRFGFSDVKVIENVVSFLEVLLVFAILLQRTLRTINIYLFFAPLLLLFLSFFEHNTMLMLFYSQGVLFLFVFMWIWQSMQDVLSRALIYTLRLYLFALPVIVLLFLVFPRISYKKGAYGFSSSTTLRLGHDGMMHLDGNNTVATSKRIVMQMHLQGAVLHPLYLRGTVLYERTGMRYVPLNLHQEKIKPMKIDADASKGDVLMYDITLLPTNKQWVYTVNALQHLSIQATIDSAKTVRVEKPITQRLMYSGTSRLATTISATPTMKEQGMALMTDDVVSAQMPPSLLRLTLHDSEKLDKLINYFAQLQIPYTLRPGSQTYSMKAFLQTGGYCVHFADTFAQMARQMGLMSRIVTGYITKRNNFIDTFGVVREEDAHAWCEIYLKDKGLWQRVDPTIYSVNAKDFQTLLTQSPTQMSMVEQASIYLQYWQYQVRNYLLNYSYTLQKSLWHTIESNTLFAVKLLAIFILFSMVVVLIALFLQRQKRVHDPFLKEIVTLVRPFVGDKANDESLKHYLFRLQADIDDTLLSSLITHYYGYRYHHAQNKKELKESIALLRKALHEKKVTRKLEI